MQGAIAFSQPAVGLLKAGAGIAVGFEQQMQAVNSVLQADGATLDKLSTKAKELGATTKFTAKQAGEGMEMLASAGFTTDQVMQGIEGTLSLAAAGALDLGSASEITANVINGMGLAAGDAGHVADVLAKAAADSATNVRAIGVAFKYSAGQARGMGISVEENAFLLGAMADAGMKGSSGGTALQNMLSALAKPTEKGAALFKKMNLQMTEMGKDGKIHLRPVADIVGEIGKEFEKIEDPIKRAKLQEEVFRKIGQKGYSALDARNDKFAKMSEAERTQRGVGSFAKGTVDGAAAKMAEIRLIGVAGAFTILQSSIEGLALEVFSKEALAPMEMAIKDITAGIGGIVQVMQQLGTASTDELEKKFGPIIVGIAIGIREAMQEVVLAVDWVRNRIAVLSGQMSATFDRKAVASITKTIVLLVSAAAAAGPLIAGIGLVGVLLSTVMIPAITGLTLIVGGVALAYEVLREEDESFMQTAMRTWGNVKRWAIDTYENAIKPFWEGMKEGAREVWPSVSKSFRGVVDGIRKLLGAGASGVDVDWKSVGSRVATMIGTIASAAMDAATSIAAFVNQVGLGNVAMVLIASKFGPVAAGVAILTSAVKVLGNWMGLDFVNNIGLADVAIVTLAAKFGPVAAAAAAVTMIAFRAGQAIGEEMLTISNYYEEIALQTASNMEDVRISLDATGEPFTVLNGILIQGAANVDASRRKWNEWMLTITATGDELDKFYGLEREQLIRTGKMTEDEARQKFLAAKRLGDAERGKKAYDAQKQGEATAKKLAVEMAEAEKNKKPCETTVNANLDLDGKSVAKATAKVKNEMDERTGFSVPPYQRNLNRQGAGR